MKKSHKKIAIIIGAVIAADFIIAQTAPSKYRLKPGSTLASDQQVAGPLSGLLGIWYPKFL